VGEALDPGKGLQPLSSEALGEQRQEGRDGCLAGELLVGGV
jgi:hypothetical protein